MPGFVIHAFDELRARILRCGFSLACMVLIKNRGPVNMETATHLWPSKLAISTICMGSSDERHFLSVCTDAAGNTPNLSTVYAAVLVCTRAG